MCRPPPTIPRRTARCNAFTADSKMLSAPAQPALAGMPIYPGSCWVSGQPGGETQHFLLHRRFSEHSLFSLASSSPSPEPPSPSFLKELQETLSNRTPPPADHHNHPGPLSLPEELLLTRFILVHRDGAQPPLSPMYDGPYLVLERLLRFFKIQVGSRQDTVSTLRLKPCRSPPDAQPAAPPHRGRPSTVPAVATVPADVPRPPAAHRRQVTFRCPVVVAPPELPPPLPLLHPSGRPARRVGPLQRFL
jgi:hypothetical protein